MSQTYFIKQDEISDIIIRPNANGSTTYIPFNEINTDYQAYLAWVAEGNTAEQWTPETNA